MSLNLSTILSPSNFLDSSCYSDPEIDDYSPQIYPSYPFPIESDDYDNRSCSERHFNRDSHFRTMSQSLSAVSASATGAYEGPARTVPIALLRPTPGKKPPRPTLPSPVNISAYTKPTYFGPYINAVLTPSTKHTARSCLTALVDTDVLKVFNKANTNRFADLITFELENQYTNISETWVRDVLFGEHGVFIRSFSQIINVSPTVWDAETQCFTLAPPAFEEAKMVTWLNAISKRLAESFSGKKVGSPDGKLACQRTWSNCTANNAPTGGTQCRKPDLVLFDNALTPAFDANNKDYKPGWEVIKAFVELSTTPNKFSLMMRNIVEKAHLMFETQPYRRFVIVLVFCGSDTTARWILVLVDRSGVMSTRPISLDGGGGVTLARVLYFLSIAGPKEIGIDDTMTIDELTGIVTHITVTGQTPKSKDPVTLVFEIVRLIHSTAQISGRATRVWLVQKDDEFYILKDSWPWESKPFSEIRHLMKINQAILNNKQQDTLKHTYPILVVGQEFTDTTATRRLELRFGGTPLCHVSRVHRRIVTQPIGDPLTSFRSKLELCNILYDVVRYLEFTAETCQVCHGDISLNNVVINRIWESDDDDDDNDDKEANTTNNVDNLRSSGSSANPDIVAEDANIQRPPALNHDLTSPAGSATTSGPSVSTPVPAKAYGLVIDYDNSFSLEEVTSYGYRVNSGTLPFMAIDSLKWKKPNEFTHQPKHDLESLFYVIITLCTYVDRPGHLRSPIPIANDPTICLDQWWAEGDHRELARIKGIALTSFKNCTLACLPSYWDDFHPVLEELHAAIWAEKGFVVDQPNMATHKAFLRILDKARKLYKAQAEEPYMYAPVVLKQFSSIKRKSAVTSPSEDSTGKRRKKQPGGGTPRSKSRKTSTRLVD